MTVAPSGSGIAFADVQKQVAKARTVRFVERCVIPEGTAQPDDAEEVAEIESPRRNWIRGRSLRRIETLDDKGEIVNISISDATSGKHVSIDPNAKTFTLFGNQIRIDLETGKTSEEQIKPSPDTNYIELFGEVPGQATVRLPSRTIDGQEVVGFQWKEEIAKKGETDTWTRTYWVHPKTMTLVRVEISHRSTDSRLAPSDWVQDEFVFDEEMPDSLFSTTPPAGYAVATESIHSIEL